MCVFVITIELSKNKVALISAEDADLAKFKWTATNNRRCKNGIEKYYAVRQVSGERKYLHREVFKRMRGRAARKGYVIDHHPISDGLDCRRENLRECKQKKNMHAWQKAKRKANR